MTKQEQFEKLEALEAAIEKFSSAVRYAKVIARMEASGKTPEKSTLLDKINESLEAWDVLLTDTSVLEDIRIAIFTGRNE